MIRDFTQRNENFLLEKFGKFIAVGQALIANSELNRSDKGSVITNLHYIGDRFWKEFNDSGLSTK